MRQRGNCRRLSAIGDRFRWCSAGLRSHRGDDGLCRRAYFWRPLQPGDHDRLWAGRRIPFSDVIPFIVFQVAGAIAAAAVLKIVAQGHPGFVLGDFASNGFGDLSPGQYNLLSCAIIEILLTFYFVLVIIGVTSAGAPAGFAPLAIGLTLTLILLIAIPVTNGSVNPARSTGPAIFEAYVDQLWFFWAAPISGALVAGIVGGALFRRESD
jgi:aquaporin Z